MSAVTIAWLAVGVAPPGRLGVFVGLAVASCTLPGVVEALAFGRLLRVRPARALVLAYCMLRTGFLGLVAVLWGTGTLAPGAHLDVGIELQNGAPDGLALLDGVTLLDALSYEGEITAATIGGRTYNLVEGTALPTAVEDSNTVAGSLIRNPDGKDTSDAAADWAFTTTVTRGAANVLTP